MRAVLMYHSIDPSGSAISVSRDEFHSHVRWLARGSVKVLPLDRVVTSEASDDVVALTFDDGFANFATDAAPLLREHGLPATLYVVSDLTGRTNAWGGKDAPGIPTLPLLDWPTLGRLAEAGVTLGGHTRTHPRLAGMTKGALEDEIGGCADRIQAETGQRPTSFAYPYGSYDSTAVDVAGAHYQNACTTELRVLNASDRSHLVPRLDMYYFRKPGRLEAWGSQSFRWRLRIRAHARALRQALHPAGK
ncbi:MAG: polysaccharide deacetylase family protein [Gemmatimonadota bacterium]